MSISLRRARRALKTFTEKLVAPVLAVGGALILGLATGYGFSGLVWALGYYLAAGVIYAFALRPLRRKLSRRQRRHRWPKYLQRDVFYIVGWPGYLARDILGNGTPFA